MNETYLFQSERLGFRTWKASDLEPFTKMNADREVMKFFHQHYDEEQSQAKMEEMNFNFEKYGFCYFAVDFLETGEFVGTIGLGKKTFPASFTPCIDIGWRISKNFWNQGLASEGAKACLNFAKSLGIKEVHSYASSSNLASTRVMGKIRMQFLEEFIHEDLKDFPHLQPFSVFKISL